MGRGVLPGLALLALVACGAAAAVTGAEKRAETREYVSGEVIVRFKPGVAASARTSVVRAEDAAVARTLPIRGAQLVDLSAGDDVRAAVQRFERRPEVVSAQPNFVYHAAVTPSDTYFDRLWGMASIGAPAAWDLATGSNAIRVAVVDTGVEYDHPDLAANTAVRGWDFHSRDADPRDENGHGTHVAGTIGANGNNAVGVAGVNWRVGLLPVRVLGATGSGTTATITDGFRYAAEQGARVVNASLGGSSYDPVMAEAIASAPDTLFVVAAGNGGRDGVGDDNDVGPAIYPCNFTAANVVCVAATDASDSLSTFSNYGATSVDLAAPGVGIWSTFAGGGYSELRGTSMAAPHVAGVAALMLARNPTLSAAELRAALLGAVDVLPSLQGKTVTGGRVNAHRALVAIPAATPASPPPPPAASPPPPAPRPARAVHRMVKKVTLCHRGRTVKVVRSQLRKHRKHGDKLGACRKAKRKHG